MLQLNRFKANRISYNHFNIIYSCKRNFGVRERIKKWRENSDTSSNKKSWLGEARRFLEYEEYNLHSFKEHLRF